MHPTVEKIYLLLQQKATAEKKAGAEAYMRKQFRFIGVDTVTRRHVCKQFISKKNLPPFAELEEIIAQMWALERDMQYAAIELAALHHASWSKDFITTIEFFITTDSWWDTVDATASLLTSVYFKKYPEQIKKVTGAWNRSNNIWLQRSSLLFQLKYRKETDTILLSKYILHLAPSKEFFVQKAIGWILREYAKTNAEWVQEFVKLHPLQPLSKREALKHAHEK